MVRGVDGDVFDACGESGGYGLGIDMRYEHSCSYLMRKTIVKGNELDDCFDGKELIIQKF